MPLMLSKYDTKVHHYEFSRFALATEVKILPVVVTLGKIGGK
jgi:hypothetical protein